LRKKSSPARGYLSSLARRCLNWIRGEDPQGAALQEIECRDRETRGAGSELKQFVDTAIKTCEFSE